MQITMRSARVNAGLNQTDICSMMNINQKTLIDWEKGRKIPRADKLMEFCEICGCDIKDIKIGAEEGSR